MTNSALLLVVSLIFLKGAISLTEEEDNHQRSVRTQDRVYWDESESGCMCPHVNTIGNWLYYCGYELKPHNSTSKCFPQAVYRCVNGRKVAIQTDTDCATTRTKCQPRVKYDTGERCEACIKHYGKTCI